MPKPNVKWICCISRMNIQAWNVPGLKVCKGSEKLELSHCYYCEFWKENQCAFNKN